MSRITIEVCVDSLVSAQAAIAGGADRLEVCSNLGSGGGATPSIGLIRILRRCFPDTPLMAMIRPRVGDFMYSDDELDVMLEEIAAFREARVAGVVIGVLRADGRVDVARTRRLVAAAHGMEVTFHRAVDMTPDVEEAFEAIESIQGITRVLTSGGKEKALTGVTTLEALAERAASGLKILPGSGVNAGTVEALLRALLPRGVREVHMSGGVWIDSTVQTAARREGMDMGGWRVWRTLEENVRAVREVVDRLAVP